MLKTIVWLIFLISLTLAQEQAKSIGKVTFPIGNNFVQNPGSTQWKGVRYYMPVFDNDKIKTSKQSRCEITFQTKKVMRIGSNSIVVITKDKAGTEEIKMSRGMAWLSLFLPKGKSHLRVRTPSSVCAIRGTVYRLETDSAHTDYRCYKGTIAVTPLKKDGATLSDTTFHVGAGEELVVVNNFEEYKKQQEKAFNDFKNKDQNDYEEFLRRDQQQFDTMVANDLKAFKKMNNIAYKQSKFDVEKDAQDDWVQWNKERDAMIKGQ